MRAGNPEGATEPLAVAEPAGPDAPLLRTSCLVNHFNYGDYALEALQSCLEQTTPLDEIVLVDDGSTDDSLARLREAFGAEPRVRIVAQQNGGQLACFNAGFAAATGDLLFFLDADDRYAPRYVETVLRWYAEHPETDFTLCAHETFGREERVVQAYPDSRDLGFAAVLSLTQDLGKLCISPTSTLAIRRSILERFLPLPLVRDWRTRADDCLFFGSCLAGARRAYLAEPLVRYRLHDRNHWYGRDFGRSYEYRRRLAVMRLVRYLLAALHYGDDLPNLAPRELKTLPAPTARHLKDYLRIVWHSNLAFLRKWKLTRALLKEFRRRKLSRGTPCLQESASREDADSRE